MFPIETQHKRIPWRWVLLMVLLGFAQSIAITGSANFTFTARQFIESPATINAISSLDVLFNLLVAAPCLYISDRIWTRHGRRKIFLVPAWIAMAACMIALPLLSGAWVVMPVIILWYIFQDVAATLGLLTMEIVPPDQRVRMATIAQWIQNFFGLSWALIIVGRFDDEISVGNVAVKGDQLIYWLGAASLIVAAVFLWVFVKERRPTDLVEKSAAEPALDAATATATGRLQSVMKDLLKAKALWPVYLLVFSQALLGTGLGAIDPLLTTEQWGYVKQDMGTNIFVGGVINLMFIPIAGWIAEKSTVLKMFVLGTVGVVVMKLGYYVFVQFILPEQRPEIVHMIFFGQAMSMFSQFSSIASGPLIYDYIPRDQMGTAQAALTFVRSITRLITLNGIGLWVTWYSGIFCPPGVYDYFSGYLFMVILNIVGLAFLANFIVRVRNGSILPVGRTGFKPVDENEVEGAR